MQTQTISTPAPRLTFATRGSYGELIGTIGNRKAADILADFQPCLPDRRIEFDRRGRGDAVNHDLYGYDAEQGVAVVQCRHSFRRFRNGFLNTRKTYVLCGFNESGTPFRHPIEAAAVHGAIRRSGDPAAVVRAAQMWMWRVTERQLASAARQGDILLVPERGLPKAEIAEKGERAVLAETHEVRSSRIVVALLADGPRLYAMNPRVLHTKGQHEPIMAVDHDGWYSVRVGREAPAWDFSARLGD